MVQKLLIALSALTFAFTPTVVQAAERQPSAMDQKEGVAGIGALGVVIGLLVVLGVILIIADDNNNHHPVSP